MLKKKHLYRAFWVFHYLFVLTGFVCLVYVIIASIAAFVINKRGEARLKAYIAKQKQEQLNAIAADTVGYTWNEFLKDTTVPIKCWYEYEKIKEQKEPKPLPTPDQERQAIIEQMRQQYEQPAGITTKTIAGSITIYYKP